MVHKQAFCKILSLSLHVNHLKWAANQCNRGLTHKMRSILSSKNPNILHFSSKVIPFPPNVSFQWTAEVWIQVVLVGNTLHQQPCATTARLPAPAAHLSLDKTISTSNSPRQSGDQVYGRALCSRTQAPPQYIHQSNDASDSSHPPPRA